MIDQYELRELHYQATLRSKELEVQYNIARYDREKKLAEAGETRSRALNAQVLTFSKTETELRNQLNIYVEKFKQVGLPHNPVFSLLLSFIYHIIPSICQTSNKLQVEDTLNNSNDLFLTFRKEMEEMSKKTKRLEKENMNLTRKHDLTNQNILKMAEERTKTNDELKEMRKKNDKLTSIINQMQKQGRGVAGGLATRTAESQEGEYIEGETESESYDHDEEGEESDGEDDLDEDDQGSEVYDEDTEEEIQPFGPVPPPAMTANGIANGIMH